MLEIVVFAVVCGYVIYQRFLHPLSRYPGPLLASLSNVWKAYHVYQGDLEYAILKLHQEHGKIVRIGPNHLDISDAAAVKDIYLTGKSFVKSSFYDAFTALRPNIFGTRDENIHAARKKALTPGFSLQSVTQMEPYIDGCLAKLLARLDAAAATGEPIDLKAWISFFVIDVLGELAFSRSFDMLERGQTEALPPLKEHVFLAMLTGQFPAIVPLVNKYLPYVPIPALQATIKGRMKLRQLAIDRITHRLSHPDPSRRDLLAKLIASYEQGDAGIDVVDIQTEAFGFIIAGSHTTAATITLLFWHLLHNPQTLAKLEDEVLAGVAGTAGVAGGGNGGDGGGAGGREGSGGSGCVPYATTTHATKAKYLAAAVTETLRINPVFTMPLMRVVPSSSAGGGGAIVAGARVPGGTDVSVTNHALHHDPAVFGGELERFVPERWLGGGGGGGEGAGGGGGGGTAVAERMKLLMPFGAGHRACIGRNLASVEINKVAASVLARYRVELVDGEEGGKGKKKAGGGGGMPPMTSFGIADLEGGLVVRLRRREVG